MSSATRYVRFVPIADIAVGGIRIHRTHVPVEEPSTASIADIAKWLLKEKDRLAAVSSEIGRLRASYDLLRLGCRFCCRVVLVGL
jgi:hypothetical protein